MQLNIYLFTVLHVAEKCIKSPTEEHKFRFGKCIWCGKEEKVPKKPTIKELMKGEVLNGYVEAARVRPLTEFREEEHSSNPGEFSVCLFCPLCLRDFSIRIESPTRATAREAAIGKTVHCPVKHEFVVEPHNITTVQAFLRPAPWEVHPIYKQKFVYVGGVATPEEMPKPPSWLIGAEIVEEKPLPPDGWRPTGTPTLKKEIPDALNTLIYQQEVRSPKYPEQVYHIQYRRDIFKKFLEEARKINKADKIEEATIYLIEHTPGITTRMIADVLGRGYWTIYRITAKLIRPESIAKLKTEIEEQAAIEKWVPTETEETIKTLEAEAAKIEKLPKATAGPLWRGQVTLYPMRHKTEEELLEELKHIFTLERYTPTPQEWEQIKQQMRKQTDAWLKQSILYWIEEKAEVTA